MWKVTELALRNIISFHEAELKIKQGVATLIFGKNEDNASQPCNGSGKSSLIEAISFALTGEQLRRVKSIEEIINDQSEDAYVYLKLENDYSDETFTIERTITRGKPQTIECHKYDSYGREIDVANTVQPTVLDYNRFILDEIGLSKDDIYCNFILCDTRYDSFFDAPDKSKKEIINRFSNGNIVDESIERLHTDMEPIKNALESAQSKVEQIKGSVSAIEKELAEADLKAEDLRNNRLKQIKRLEEQVLDCRENIKINTDNRNSLENKLQDLNPLKKYLQGIEEGAFDSGMPLEHWYNQISSKLATCNLAFATNYVQEASSLQLKLNERKDGLAKINQQIIELTNQVKLLRDNCETHLSEYNEVAAKKSKEDNYNKNQINNYQQQLNEIEGKLDELENQLSKNKIKQTELESNLSRISVLLGGVVTCPKCNHTFLPDSDTQVETLVSERESANRSIESLQVQNNELASEFKALDQEANSIDLKIESVENIIKERKANLEKYHQSLLTSQRELSQAEQRVTSTQTEMVSMENSIGHIEGKIDVLLNRMLGEAMGKIDGEELSLNHQISECNSNINYYDGRKSQYLKSLIELKEKPEIDFASSLKNSLAKYRQELKDAEEVVNEFQAQWNELKAQEINFTMFKSHLARKKIDALSLIVNDFLEKIGSDIRLKIEGFSVTKTGKLRDKISIQVMRDGLDCGSYQKFSGGEKARLNLACILSLHTLINSNCELGKGLDFIIIDELLDKSDEMGMASYCEALNKLGQTALLITQGAVSESYPHKLLIVKKQGVSTIDNL